MNYKGPMTYAQAQIELSCSRTSLYRMMLNGTVIRKYMTPPKGCPRVFIPTDPAYYQARTAGGEEDLWQNSITAKDRQVGGPRSRIRGAAKRLDDLLESLSRKG